MIKDIQKIGSYAIKLESFWPTLQVGELSFTEKNGTLW